MKYDFEIPLEILSKKNAWYPGKHGIYLDGRVSSFLDAAVGFVKLRWIQGYKQLNPITEPVRVMIEFENKLMNKDIDNQISSILDILQSAGVIKNDKQVFQLSAVKHKGEGSCTVTVEVIEIDE